MEVVGFAASVIGIIQLAGKITAVGYGYIGSVSRAPEDVRKLMAEIASLSEVLHNLEDYAGPKSTILQTLNEPLRGCFLELEGLQLKLKSASGFRGRFKKVFGLLRWPLKEAETLQIIAQIERHKGTLALALSKYQITLSKSIQEDVKHVGSSVQVFHKEFQAECTVQSSVRADEKRRIVLDWLYPEDVHKKHIEISNRRQADTGQWLLESPEYKDWVEGKQGSRLLWGYGIPGAGKTFLSSLIIDNFLSQIRSGEVGLAYIYFDYKERDSQRPERIISSLIKQLVSQLPTLPINLEELHRRVVNPGELAGSDKRISPGKLLDSKKILTTDDLYGVLASTFGLFGRVFLVFDALDECDQKSQRNILLPLFHKMGEDGAKLFLTSRKYLEDIQISFRDVAKLELSAQDRDIRKYVQKEINENPRAARLVAEAKCEEQIISGPIGCANGMFLLVRFHIEYLCQQTTPRQLTTALEALKTTSSTGLDPTYDRVIDTLRKQAKSCVDLAISVFSWLIKARQALTIQEIQVAISVEPNCFEINKLELPDRATILEVCGGLVTIDDNSGTIRLTHLTVQEYLIRKSVIPKQADITISQTCVTYLSLDVFASGACESITALNSRFESYPFFKYAVRYLPVHLKLYEEDLSKDMVLEFLKRPGNICSWMQATMYLIGENKLRIEYYKDFFVEQIALDIASAVGNSLVVRQLLEGGADVSKKAGSEQISPLARAVYQGHKEIAQILIEYGADIEVLDKDGCPPIHDAAGLGNYEMVKFLIEQGADVSAQGIRGCTALQSAAYGGHYSVVQLLLDKGADIEARGNDGWTALYTAASNGHHAVVQLLLDKGADIEARDNDGWPVLYDAAANGHYTVVQLLLGKGADIEAQANNRWTALHTAASNGHHAVVQLLLDKGADIEARDNDGWTALHTAASNGHHAVVQLLLGKGADIEARDNDGWTVLYTTAHEGHYEVVQLLLDKGADIEVQAKNRWTALHAAASNGHHAVVRLLLDKGADIEARDDDGWTVLYTTARECHHEVFQLLLEKGADIEARGDDGWTALYAAARRGDYEVAQLLLEKGADIEAQDNDRHTALHIAADYGHHAVVQLLLEKGADIEAQDNGGHTALHTAANCAHHTVVQLLLDKGADIEAQDNNGMTAPQLATSKGNHKLFQPPLVEDV